MKKQLGQVRSGQIRLGQLGQVLWPMWLFIECTKRGDKRWCHQTDEVQNFMVAKLLYNYKCSSNCLSVFQLYLEENLRQRSNFYSVQNPHTYEHLFYRYFILYYISVRLQYEEKYIGIYLETLISRLVFKIEV